MMKKYFSVMLIGFVLSLMISGCAAKKQAPLFPLMRLSVSDYPEFGDDMAYDGLRHGISQSISYLKQVPADKKFQFGEDMFDAAHMIRSLEHFLDVTDKRPSARELKKFIASNYLVYKSVGAGEEGNVLFTGYYEPLLHGSLYKNNEYKFPVYARPDDLMTIELSSFSPEFKGKKITGRLADQTFVPYYERKEIEEQGVLENKAEVIAWVRDRISLFFLQIQGSGKISLDNGKIINVHYNSQNGQPYRSIGKLLIEKGKIPKEEMSMQRLREYLREHPEEAEPILNHNASYVFFSLEEEGPFGALNVTLTPGRSIAVDRRVFPLSGLAFIETQKPLTDGSGKISRWINFPRFVLSQDTGGAIRGPGRADIFWGNGAYAEIAAGYMQHRGNLYLLILKPEITSS
ncbi:murein transglycosylase A [Desulfonema magnum]|uniref:peptidoglycan lytic exotransglycosylase n=1 Tax=Desulfonema magnum TaxID=45655 RepID=A0A975BLP1_9BACT|nr:MltA domain-containing protein [Desulfonema magnum]QTA87453.1 Lytic transglycosylase domain-containing protein, MltA-domain [Desulfonema magnum]